MSDICQIHKKDFICFCVSEKCKQQHAAICSSQECISKHAHPIKQTISIQKIKSMITEASFPLTELTQKIKTYFQQIRGIFLQHLQDDQLKLLDIVRRYQYCEDKKNYLTLFNILENRHSSNSADDISKLYNQLNIKNRRDRVQESANKYQAQLNFKNIYKLIDSQLYKMTVLKNFSARSESLQSNIIKDDSKFTTLLKNYGVNPSYFKRIFSAKQHKFLAQQYHKAVDHRAPTLTLIKANNHTFGCYLNCKINNTNTWIPDSSKKSFIFSLDNETVHPLIDSKETICKAAYGGNKGPQIGSGLDIYICDRSNEVKKSGSMLGGSYQLPEGLQYKSQQSSKYLAGQSQFLVQDYQVYSLI